MMDKIKITTILIIGFLFISNNSLLAQSANKRKFKQLFSVSRNVDIKNRNTEKHSKLVAVGLNLSLGLFGVHRLYLGTSPKVPIIYTFTLGGGGFLMLADLGVIIFTNDLEQYSNNSQIIMWGIE